MNLICKLIMNSYYGRFGMKPIISTQVFTNKKGLDRLRASNFPILDVVNLDELGLFVTYEN